MGGVNGRVLKKGSEATGAATAAGRVGDVQDAVERAGRIVAEAEAHAAAVRARAEVEAGLARTAAIAEGHADGLARAAAAMAMAAQVREAKLAELDAAVVEVALEVARRVLGRELVTSPQAVLDVARRALRAAAGAGDILLRVAPADLGAVREGEGPLRALLEHGTLSISEDPTLQRGEVIVETSGGRVDARIGTQLEAFRRALGAEER